MPENQATLTAKIKQLETLVMLYEATVYCVTPVATMTEEAGEFVNRMMRRQIAACGRGHREIIGEEPCYAELLKKLGEWTIDDK